MHAILEATIGVPAAAASEITFAPPSIAEVSASSLLFAMSARARAGVSSPSQR